ncbi:protein terminal ear1 homolog [Telopea speciosissima]|uniref:protein terminal ear1 homolog n=1 Tax=Telopea speciosissima TaxID=54955 RepID=UPI001CC55F16|nr:protein terminal ear1 homolog [Telopea speciosissima]
MSEEEKEMEMVNPCAKEDFKPSNPAEEMERVVVTKNNHQKLDSHGRKNIIYLRSRFDYNINKWFKVPLPPFRLILLRFRGITSLMIQNIPNRLSRKMLIQLLDEHCKEKNKVILGFKINPPTPPSEYDFVYLPMDFKSNLNKGYAFVNFTTTAGAFRFFRAYDKYKWDLFQTRKTCEIDFAEIQGREDLVKHFMKSNFICDSKDYLPVQFFPPRNGLSSQATRVSVVGRRCVPPLQKCK